MPGQEGPAAEAFALTREQYDQLMSSLAKQVEELNKLHAEHERLQLEGLQLSPSGPGTSLTAAGASSSAPLPGKQEGVKQPASWNPKQEPWAAYEPVLITYLRNCNCPQQQWGMRALMYIPPDAVRAFYTSLNTTAAAATTEITLHPALQSATRINPQTNHEFSTYQELREYLVQFKPEAERLIRDWEKLHSGSTPRQFNGGSSRPFNGGGNGNSKPLGVRGGVRKSGRLSDTWTKEQRDIAAKGLCVYCQKPFVPKHDCLRQARLQGRFQGHK